MNITNTESNTVLTGTSSGDSIQNAPNAVNVTISGLAGDDTLKNWGANVSISAGAGNDTVYNQGDNVVQDGGAGKDSMTNWGSFVTINGGADADSLINAADNVTIFGDTGADTVLNQGNDVSIDGGADNDFIQNTGSRVTISATSGNNFFANATDSVTIAGGTDSDTVHNQGSNVSINTGAGIDSIQNIGSIVKIYLDDGDDKIDNFAETVTISGGAGADSIGNWAGGNNVSISGGAGNDSIYNNGGSNVTLAGDDGNDTISNFYASVLINGGADDDSIYNDATKVTINGEAGSDTVDNRSASVSINGGSGNDSLTNVGDKVTILGGAGNDTITNKTIVYANNDGSRRTLSPDNVSINGGNGNDVLINTGGENVKLGGGKFVSLNGGAGNDTLIGSTNAEVFIYDSGDDVITNYSGEDTVKITSGSIDSYYTDNSDLIFKIGDGSLTLQNMQGRYITVTDSSGKTSSQLYGSNGYTAQDAIKNLVHAWNKTFLSGTAKLDESIKLSTHFSSIQEAIDQMIADCEAAGDADTFLRKYCGIILDNSDTGAISGWDAGGSSIKTPDDVVGEILSSLQHVPDYTDTTFTARNLTINIKSTGSSLNADGKKTFDGLYSWWADEAVKLIEDSYDLAFSAGDSIRVEMVPSATYAGNTSSTGVVKFNQGSISFASDDDYNGNGIDRTIAHEFTHVAQNFLMGGQFPQFLMEGLADLTSGIDESGGKSEWLESLAANPDSLANYLDLNNSSTGDTPYYAAGYMFYRYLTRQAALAYDAANDYPFKDGSYISGTDDPDLLTGSASNVTLSAGKGNDTLTAYGDGMKLQGDAGNDIIYNSGSNVLFSYADGDGNDVINGFNETSTLQIAADKFTTSKSGNNIIVTIGDGKVTLRNAATLETVNIYSAKDDSIETYDDGSADKVTLGSAIEVGDASARMEAIRLTGNALDNSIFGGSGKDTLYGKDGDDFIQGNAGADKLYGQNGNDTIWGGIGNDTLTGGEGADLFIFDAGNDVISDYAQGDKVSIGADVTASSVKGSDATFTIGSNTLTVKNGKSKEIVFLDAQGDERTIIGGAYLSTDSMKSAVTLSAAWREVGDASERTTAIKLTGNANNNTLLGGSGKDTLYGKDGDDYLVGNAGADKLYGQNGDDTLWGGAGNDTLTGGEGADLFVFDAGNDVISDYATGDKISVNADVTASSVKGSDATFTIGSNTLTVKNGKGKEVVFLDADGNERTIIGGAYLSTDSMKSAVTLSAAWREVGDASERTTAIKLTGNANNNTLLGGSGKDTLYGKDGDDYLVGNDGADKLYGQNGDDTLWGGAGNDTLTGGEGADLFVFDAGNDVISDYAQGDKISVNADVTASSVKGSDATFTIGSNTLTVKNGKGKEVVFLDADGTERTIIGGAYISTDSMKSAVTLSAAWREVGDASERTTAIKLTGNANNNTLLGGSGKDTLYGKDGDDYLVGNAGADKLYGQNGDDTLWGGIGNDTLKGGAGADTFIYNSGEGKDVIADFGDDDFLQITGTFSATYNESKNTIAFKVGSTASAITLKNFTASTFNINGEAWRISDTKLVK